MEKLDENAAEEECYPWKWAHAMQPTQRLQLHLRKEKCGVLRSNFKVFVEGKTKLNPGGDLSTCPQLVYILNRNTQMSLSWYWEGGGETLIESQMISQGNDRTDGTQHPTLCSRSPLIGWAMCQPPPPQRRRSLKGAEVQGRFPEFRVFETISRPQRCFPRPKRFIPDSVYLLPPNVGLEGLGSCHKRQKPQAPTPQAPIRNAEREKSQTPKVLTAILT